jgi:hypothetical protein
MGNPAFGVNVHRLPLLFYFDEFFTRTGVHFASSAGQAFA